jgi:HK97 family phage portal protein
VETPAQREERIQTLEQRRSNRASGVWPTPDEVGTGVVEVGPGRGDLSYSSTFFPSPMPTALGLLGTGAVSFARLFQSQPWVAAAVMRMLTWAIRVPLKAYRRKDDPHDRLAIGDDQHPVAHMIAHPWDRAGQAQLVMNLLGPVLVHGNSATAIDDTSRSGNIGLSPKDWRYTMPIMPWRGALEGFRFDTDTPQYTQEISIDKVLHIAWWSPTGPIGTSPLMQLGVTIQVEDAAQRYQKSLFMHGGRPPTAIVSSDAFLGMKPAERSQIMKQLRADVTEIYGTPDQGGKPALLPPGLDWKAIGQTTVEAALIDQRKIAREEICGVYLIPPPMLGMLDRATYSNIETQREMTYTDCLGPPLILIEQAINTQIIRDLLQIDDVFVEFDFSAVLRGDRLKEISGVRDAIASALLSPNEGRNVLGRPSVDDEQMDQYWLPTNNLTAITGEEDVVPVPPIQPPPPPNAPPNAPPQPPAQGGGPTLGHDSEKKLHVVSGGREYILDCAHA